MSDQLISPHKRLATEGAIKGFFTCMNSHMQLKVATMCKRLVTQGANIGLFASMSSHMAFKLISL
jgi:hypothetical protein